MECERAPRRRHSAELKAQVMAECDEPGASIAAVAQSHGLNANLLHKWRRGRRLASAAKTTLPGIDTASTFVALQLPPQPATTPMRPDIRIELRRGVTVINVSWPCTAASDCAAWMRELLR